MIVNHAKHRHHHLAIATSLSAIKTIVAKMSVSHVTVTNHFVINQTDVRTSVQRNPLVSGPTGRHSANALPPVEKVT